MASRIRHCRGEATMACQPHIPDRVFALSHMWRHQMKLAIIAATGGVGQQLLRQALDAGHDVTAVVRNPARLPAALHEARIVTADLADPEPAVLEAAISG